MAIVRSMRAALFALALHVPLALAAPQNGWWWNPNESGRGFFIEIVDGFAYIGAYVYAPDGRSDWVVSQGAMATPTSYSGRLLSFRGGQTLVGDHRAPGPATDVGAIGIQFSDDTHATLTWPGGTVPIERLAFDQGAGRPLPRTGWWWNPQEAGTGFSIEVQGSTLFLVGFMYDAAGEPVWYYTSGAMASPGSYSGSLLAFANGQPIVGAYRPPTLPRNAGTISIAFTAPDEATMTLNDGAPAVAGVATKRARSRTIKPTLTPRLPSLPRRWAGTLKLTETTASADGNIHTSQAVSVNATWSEGLVSGSDVTHPLAASVGVRATYTGPLGSLGTCNLSGAETDSLPSGSGTLKTNGATGHYDIEISGLVRYQLGGDCVVDGPGGPVSTRIVLGNIADVTVKLSGTIDPSDGRLRIAGHKPATLQIQGGSGQCLEEWTLEPAP